MKPQTPETGFVIVANHPALAGDVAGHPVLPGAGLLSRVMQAQRSAVATCVWHAAIARARRPFAAGTQA